MPPLPLMALPPIHPRFRPPGPTPLDETAAYADIPRAAARGRAAIRTGLFSRGFAARFPRETSFRAGPTKSRPASSDAYNRGTPDPGPDTDSPPQARRVPTPPVPEPAAVPESARHPARNVVETDHPVCTEAAGDGGLGSGGPTPHGSTAPCRCENIVDSIRSAREERGRRLHLGARLPAAATGRPVRASPRAAHDCAAGPHGPEEPPPEEATAPHGDDKPRGARRRVQPRLYTRVHVLTVHWATSPTSTAPPAAVRALKAVVRRIYGYAVSHCALPASADAAGILAGSLSALVHGLDPRAKNDDGDGEDDAATTLLVVHYAGPSRTDPQTFHIHPPAWPLCAPAATVDLQRLLLQTLLRPSVAPDVLVLLDCAYAAAPSLGAPLEGKEILAASTEATGGFSVRAPGRGDLGFTRGLARVMEGSTWSVHVHADELGEALARGAPGLDGGVALVVGCGPARRHVLVAPVVTPWWYWRGVLRVAEAGGGGAWGRRDRGVARCKDCGTLGRVGSLVHRCIWGKVQGHSWEYEDRGRVGRDIELDELVENRWLR